MSYFAANEFCPVCKKDERGVWTETNSGFVFNCGKCNGEFAIKEMAEGLVAIRVKIKAGKWRKR